MVVLACGPFIGDWEQEILNFRPFIQWVYKSYNPKDIYLSTHFNRSFIYQWIDDKNFLPIYHHLTRNELSQTGSIHKNLPIKDYSLMIKIFKEEILKRTNVNKRDITVVNVPYTKNSNFPFYNKYFSKIECPDIKIKKKYSVVYIPDISEDEERLVEIYKLLKKNYDVGVIGDLKTYLEDVNVVTRRVDYFENGYKYIIKYIMEADIIICPASHWTLLCNQQKVPVFSWGENIGRYSKMGIYNLGNEKCFLTPTTSETPAKEIFKTMQYFINSF